MKQTILIIFYMLSLFLTAVSCQEDGYIGHLYGQWQITSVQEGTTVYHPDNLYLAFQNDVVFARITGTDDHFTYQLKGAFRHEGDSLYLNIFIDDEAEGADVMHDYLNTLFHFPQPHNELRFSIDQLDNSHLILSQPSSRWQLRSY